MTPETVIAIGQNALYVTSVIIALLLLPALGVGLLVSMFQAATQINEQTLSFIPKLFVVIAVLFIGGHWILATLIDYMTRLLNDIPSLIG
ncbi:MAG: flagellar biosynthesis protein FliQ [Gammaproteobacteria bacterium]|jgi:flagellar biosynthetic protein FliQ|nr:flagellar biosynthesis protein FliQ [Gammaproteobacteria bacterium]